MKIRSLDMISSTRATSQIPADGMLDSDYYLESNSVEVGSCVEHSLLMLEV